ncbi:MAG: hypothetical protein AB8E74_00835 [Prochlorococcus sp.]|nr:hypothetical protein [Prochlorococcaceae cyanobacterium Fu_MAG_50]
MEHSFTAVAEREPGSCHHFQQPAHPMAEASESHGKNEVLLLQRLAGQDDGWRDSEFPTGRDAEDG